MDYDSKNLSTESLSFETQQIDSSEAKNSPKERFSKGYLRKFICRQPEWFRSPDYNRNRYPDSTDFRNVRLETTDGNFVGCHIVAPRCVNKKTRFVVLLHGRQTNRAHFAKHFPVAELVSRNFCVLSPDVRGFGDSTGNFDVGKISEDIARCCDYLVAIYGCSKIHFITHCIGAGIALEFYKSSLNQPIHSKLAKIVLISPCISELDLCGSAYGFKVLKSILRQSASDPSLYAHLSHNNVQNIALVPKSDVIVVHGLKDKHVPYEHGLLLANTAGCRLYRSENDGYYSILNNLEVLNIIDSFLIDEELLNKPDA